MADFSKFFITRDDGYSALTYYEDSNDDAGRLVMYADAGTSLTELVKAAEEFTAGGVSDVQ